MNLHEWDTLTKAGEVPPPSPETLARVQSAVRRAATAETPRRRHLVPLLAAVAVAVAAAVVGTFVVNPFQDDPAPPVAGGQPIPTATLPSYRGDDTAASCVGSPERGDWLKNQAFAFDGTVLAIEEPAAGHPEFIRRDYTTVTFKVTHWYQGGRGPAVRALIPGPADPRRHEWNSVSGYGLPFQLGDRMLVSGQVFEKLPASRVNWVGWSCGFSGLYDEKTARHWAGTFGR